MALPSDLDQSGGIPQVRKVYLGPTVGWKYIDSPLYIQHALLGGGLDISVGVKPGLIIPSNAVIVDWTLGSARDVGNLQLDVWKITKTQWLAGTLPSAANSIAGTDKPRLVAQSARQSTALTGWTTLISQDDVIFPNVESCSGVKVATLVLTCVTIIGPS